MTKIKIGILEFGYRKKGSLPYQILNNVFDCARKADEMGFSRFWLGEHYGGSPAWHSPQTLVPVIAGFTERIKIGVAGVLIGVHQPFHLAMNFKLYSNLFPNRIDLGIAKGKPEDKYLKFFQKNVGDKEILFKVLVDQNTEELLTYFKNDEALRQEHSIYVPPFSGEIPNLWKLTSTFNSLDECIKQKMNISRSLFHGNVEKEFDNTVIMQFQKEFFRQHQSYPEINLAFAGACATQQIQLKKNDWLIDHGISDDDSIIGSPAYLYDKINQLAEKYSVNEFVMLDLSKDFKKKIRSLELISKAFSLA